MFGNHCGADPLVRSRPPGRPLTERMGLIWLGEEQVQEDPRGPGGPLGPAPAVSCHTCFVRGLPPCGADRQSASRLQQVTAGCAAPHRRLAQSQAAPPQIHPGVWKFRLGAPEAIRHVATRRYMPATAGLTASPAVASCPVTVSGSRIAPRTGRAADSESLRESIALRSRLPPYRPAIPFCRELQ